MDTSNLGHEQASASKEREGLTLERYAEVMAYRRHFPPSRRAEVLSRLGVSPRRWAAATKAWGAAFTEALERDDPDLLLLFARALGTTARRLREFPLRLEDLGDPLEPPTGGPDERAALAEVPSYLLEQATPTPQPRASPPTSTGPSLPPSLVETGEISAYVPRPVLPFQPAPPRSPETPAPKSPRSGR